MELNLNLIPAYKREAIEAVRRRRIFAWQIAAALFMSFVFGSILAGFNLMLGEELKTIAGTPIPKNQIQNAAELQKYDEEFKDANSQIAVLDEIQKGEFVWSNLFMNLGQTIPDGITAENVYTKKTQVFISGIATTRDNLSDLKSKLESNACFENINFPLSNFASRDNVAFQLDFSIKDNCIKR